VADALVIRLPAHTSNPAEWVRVSVSDGRAGEVVQGQLDMAAEIADSCRVILLVPSNQVLRVKTQIPLTGATRIRQSLPFALEEQLAGDIEAQHFACSGKDSEGYVSVAVVESARLSGWLDQLREHQLVPLAVYADSDALPTAPATMTVLLDHDQAIIRSASGELTIVDESSVQPALELLLDQQLEQLENDISVAPINLLVYCDSQTHQRYQELWDRLRMRVQDIDILQTDSGALPLLATRIASKGGVNLLQGSFAPKTEFPLRWQQWRVAAMLLAGVLLLSFIVKGAEFFQLSRANTALNSAASQILEKTFPAAIGAPDPWTELRTRLGSSEPSSAASNTMFVDVLQVLSKAFTQTSGIQMESMSFRSGELSLQLTAPDVASLDQLRQLISDSRRFSAEIQSANPADNVVKGSMLIVQAGAAP
jgi:general secretion pathway protein L